MWDELHQVLLDRLGDAEQIDWQRAWLDSSSIPAKKGEQKPLRIRRIKAKRDRSAILWSTGEASR